MSQLKNYRKSLGVVVATLVVLLSPTALFAATSGSGTMSVTPKGVQPSATGKTFSFTFNNNTATAFASGSAITVSIPTEWTAPQTTSSSGEGYVTVAETGGGINVCNPGAIAISGSGPWTITVPQTCGANDEIALTYGAGTSLTKVIAPATIATHTFTTQTRNGVTAFANISSQPTIVVDGTSPTLIEVTPITSTTTDTTPSYTFSSTEAGTISYAGGCASIDTSANAGNNTISFNTLSFGIHSTCTIRVTDAAGNQSALLNVSPFTIVGPDLVAVITNDLSSGNAVIGTPFHWTIIVSNIGSATASFGSNDTVITDSLPSIGASYSISATSTSVGVTGKMLCSITTNTLSCSTPTAVSGSLAIPAGGSVTVIVTATPTANGNLVNPRAGGSCKTDPSNPDKVNETNENNNTCANTVTVATIAIPTIVLTPSTLSGGTTNSLYTQTLNASTSATSTFDWTIAGGALPLGLTFGTSTGNTAIISGSPTTAGTSTFVVKVTNGFSSTTQSYAIVIAPEPVVTPTTATVHVVTNVINDNGGSNSASNFGIYITGANPLPTSFSGSSVGTSVTVVAGQPYSVSVPTLTYSASFSPDCNSTLTASDSVTCTITLDDIAPLPSGQNPQNLVVNALLEVPSLGNQNIPDQWNKGFDDIGNAVTYIYPATSTPDSDISSGNAAKIVATSFALGTDAKWYFNPAQVISGQQYAFSDSYVSDVNTDLVAAFCTDAFLNGCSYGFASAPATPLNTWKQSSAVFTVPLGKTYMTVFHRIAVAGTLTIDNFSLTLVPAPAPFSSGFVTLSFDDSLASQYDNARAILQSSNIKATFYAISHFVPGFSVINSSLEDGTANPSNWDHSGSSASTTSYDYPSDPHTGLKGARVSSSVTGSNAAWYFTPITVLPDGVYTYRGWYKSTAASELVAQVTMNDGTITTADVTDINGVYLSDTLPLSASANYAEAHAYFYVPDNAKSITVLNRLKGAGELIVDDVSLGLEGYMTDDQLLELQGDGNEVGGHTQTHANLTAAPSDVLIDEVNGGRQDILNNGGVPVVSFAYPYGAYNQSVQQELQNAGYSSGRTVTPGFNGKTTPKYALLSQSVNADTSIAQVDTWIDEAKADKTWLILTFHNIQNNLTNLPYGATPATLQTIIDHINQKGVQTKTVSEGVALMNIATLTVSTVVNNTYGATSTPADFTIEVSGASATPNSFSGSVLGTSVALDANQSYAASVTSIIPANYDDSYSAGCSGTISLGGNAVCTITISDKTLGTISAAVDASTPVSSIVVGGTLPKVASFKFTSSNDSFTISELDAKVASVSDATAISSLVFKDGATTVASVPFVGATASATGLTIALSSNTNKVIDVYAQLGNIGTGGANAGVNVGVTLTSFTAQGSVGSSSQNVVNISGNPIYAYKTKPTVTRVALPSTILTLGTNTIAHFSVTADAGGTVSWRKIKFNPTLSVGVALSGTPVLYDTANPSTPLSGMTCVASVSDIVCTSAVDQEVIGSKTYLLKATVTGTIVPGSTLTVDIPTTSSVFVAPTDSASVIASTASFVWSDESIAPHSLTTLDWANDFLVKQLPVTMDTLTANTSGSSSNPPVITLNGSSTLTIAVGSTYIDAGATAFDNEDGNLTSSIVVGGDTVTTIASATFHITYNVSDSASNAAPQVTRTVIVKDVVAPVIILTGDATINLHTGDTYTDAGAVASDDIDPTVTVVVGGQSVNTATPGSYLITYDATDVAGNHATQVTRTVVVSDSSAPTITLHGDNPLTLHIGDTYTDAGATAQDDVDGDLTSHIVVGGDTVVTSGVGSFTVTYNVNDSANNPAITRTRVVNVVDATLPVITLTGSSTVNVNAGDVYSDAGATAIDNVDGTVQVVVGGDTVNTSIPNTYHITYDATDAAGNHALQITRTVIVTDVTAPVITLTGASTINVAIGTTYTDLGATSIDNVDGTVLVVVGGDTVNTSTSSSYVITYNAVDAAGNHALQVTRTVVVSSLAISTETSGSIAANSITISWTTSHPATSRVVFDTISHSDASTTADGTPNYGYANSTTEDTTLVTNHSVTVSGLSASTAYFFRSVSHGSPEVFGNEVTATTIATPPVSSGGGGGGGGSSYVYGCTDKNATNYSAYATANNGSCTYAATTTASTSTSTTSTGGNTGGTVLGAATTTCSDYLKENLRFGSSGSEVKKLQDFLIAQGFLAAGNNSGIYGPMTRNAVSAFQLKYKAEILTPNGLTSPTGSVLTSTRAMINKIVCSEIK